MWDITDLKKRAWNILTKNYWWALLAAFLTMVIQVAASSIVSLVSSIAMPTATTGLSLLVSLMGRSNSSAAQMAQYVGVLSATAFFQFLVAALSFAIIMFVSAPLNYGLTNFYMQQRNHEKFNNMETIFSAFRKDSYKRVTIGMAWGYLWQYIWSFCSAVIFIIPTVSLIFGAAATAHFLGDSSETGVAGAVVIVICALLYFLAFVLYFMIVINRMYAYLYIPYLLVDQPQLSYREVMNMSKKMTDGQKGRMFLLDLSFIGWWLLVMLTCGYLSIALLPYIQTTRVELYFARKEQMEAQNSVSE